MTTSLRFAAVTVLLIFGGALFGATKLESYVVGVGVGLALVALYGFAQRWETR